LSPQSPQRQDFPCGRASRREKTSALAGHVLSRQGRAAPRKTPTRGFVRTFSPSSSAPSVCSSDRRERARGALLLLSFTISGSLLYLRNQKCRIAKPREDFPLARSPLRSSLEPAELAERRFPLRASFPQGKSLSPFGAYALPPGRRRLFEAPARGFEQSFLFSSSAPSANSSDRRERARGALLLLSFAIAGSLLYLRNQKCRIAKPREDLPLARSPLRGSLEPAEPAETRFPLRASFPQGKDLCPCVAS